MSSAVMCKQSRHYLHFQVRHLEDLPTTKTWLGLISAREGLRGQWKRHSLTYGFFIQTPIPTAQKPFLSFLPVMNQRRSVHTINGSSMLSMPPSHHWCSRHLVVKVWSICDSTSAWPLCSRSREEKATQKQSHTSEEEQDSAS